MTITKKTYTGKTRILTNDNCWIDGIYTDVYVENHKFVYRQDENWYNDVVSSILYWERYHCYYNVSLDEIQLQVNYWNVTTFADLEWQIIEHTFTDDTPLNFPQKMNKIKYYLKRVISRMPSFA